jgi:undecaprenyl-diphosphatase
MLEWLDGIDRAVFLFINVTLANPVTDLVMPIVTGDFWLRLGSGVAMALVLWKGNARLRWLVIFSALALVISDQLSAGFLKPLIGRVRPCQVLENINLLVGCGGGKAMPSSHAANAFGQAVLFGVLYRRVRYGLLAFAVIVALSRVFVGVHYPGDILAGALVGTAAGLAMIAAYRLFMEQLERRNERKA